MMDDTDEDTFEAGWNARGPAIILDTRIARLTTEVAELTEQLHKSQAELARYRAVVDAAKEVSRLASSYALTNKTINERGALDRLRSRIAALAEGTKSEPQHNDHQEKFCLCSDPDYCLRGSSPEYRERAIAYRKAHGAPLPLDALAALAALTEKDR
jgi:hypothetical protein